MQEAPDSFNSYLDLVWDTFRDISRNEPILVYEGVVTHQVMKAFSEMVQEQMEKNREPENVQRRLYHIMVESLQNINRHAESGQSPATNYPGRGAVILVRKPQDYELITVNRIRRHQVEELKGLMDEIHPLDKEQLGELYKKQMLESSLSEKGGAGLGLIDIMRKTGSRMTCDFLDTKDDDDAFLIFNVKLSRTGNDEET